MKKARKPLKEKVIEAGILNFKIHSDSPNKYEHLFELLSLITHVGVRGSEYGTIGYVKKLEESFLFGEIYLFLNIDPDSPWYDAQKRIPIESDALGMETRIFDRLKPHLKQRMFVFDLRNHRLFFDPRGFSPMTAKRFFENLCAEAGVVSQIGDMDIEVHSSQESIKQILAIPKLTFLEISVTLPNPDDLTEAQEALYNDLRAEGTLRYVESRRSSKHVGITPGSRTTDLIEISRTEGYTWAAGFDENKPIKISTQEHPEIIREVYYPDKEKPLSAFLRAADALYNKFVR